MDSKLLLVKSITLLYRESQIPKVTENSADLVTAVLAQIKPPENFVAMDFGKDVISSLRETALWMVKNPLNQVYEKTEFLQRIRVNTEGDESLLDAIKEGIEKDFSLDELQALIKSYRLNINTFLNQMRLKDIVKGYSTRMIFQPEIVDWEYVAQELRAELEPFEGLMKGVTDGKHPGIVDSIDLSDLESLVGVLTRSKDELDEAGIIKFGWRGLNRMFGSIGGGRRGEFIVVGALQHNFKSDFCLNTMRQAAVYNKPLMRDPSKKPCIIRFSFENSAAHDITSLYKQIYENETRTTIDIRRIDPIEAAKVVAERLEVNGYKVFYHHADPSDFTFRDLFDITEKHEADGYEIHAIWADYLNMISKRGCNTGAHGQDTRDLFRRVRNYYLQRGVLFITPHQLSTEAKKMLRQGMTDFVKEIPNKGLWDSCSTIDQEVDMEIYLHIEKVNGESYLTMQRGKHRKVGITPAADMYTVYKFEPYGIIDDVFDRDMSRRSVGGGIVADGGGAPWYDQA